MSAYENAVRELTRRCNASVIETLGKAIDFMETKTYEEILQSWWLLDVLKDWELSHQESIMNELESAPVPLLC